MLKIKIGETEFERLETVDTEEEYNGAKRRTMTVTCAPDAISLDELTALLSEENLETITLSNTEGIPVYRTNENGEALFDENGAPVVDHYETATAIYTGYVLRLFCGLQTVKLFDETPDTEAVYVERLVFKLGKRTYTEEQLHQQVVSLQTVGVMV